MRKRCQKGKSCGATCIYAQKVCLLDLGSLLSRNLGRAKKEISPSSGQPVQNALSNTLKNQLKPHIDQIGKVYKELKNLEGQNLPSGELWRVKAEEDKLAKARSEVSRIGESAGQKGGALAYLASQERKAQQSLYSQEEIKDRATKLAAEVRSDRIAKKDYQDKWGRLTSLIDLLEDGRTKRDVTILANAARGKRLKVPIEHSLKSVAEAQKVGSAYLKQFSGLSKVVDLLDRYSKVRATMVRRLKDPSLPEASRAALEKRMAKVLERRMFHTERLVAIMSEIREGMLKTNLSDKQVDDLLARVRMVNQSSGIVKGHAEEFIRMFNGRGFSDYGDESKVKAVRSITDSPDRAKAVLASGSIYTNVGKSTTFHELAHIVESQRPWMTGFAVTWRNGKGADSAEARELTGRPLAAAGWQTGPTGKTVPAFPLNQFAATSYRDDEIAVVGKFYSPYMGKVYAPISGSRQLSTEVWSVAFEQFANVSSMAKFYKVHPDLFEAVVGLALSP